MSLPLSSTPHLTFVVPVRHHENSRDWSLECENLLNTTRSIAAQTEPGWAAVVVVNEGAPLPELPAGVIVKRVDFSPNLHHDVNAGDFRSAMDAFRRDKGRRVLAGMRALPGSEYFMIVDGDDFVNRQISAHVKAGRGGAGWYLAHGYGVNYRGTWSFLLQDLFHLYRIPPEDDPAFIPYISKRLGSHGAITELFAEDGHPLAPVPFPGAAYVVGHPNSHSISNTLLRQYILNKDSLRRPWTLPSKLSRIRLVDSAFRQEFMGEHA
jgi:hypothetical protein